MAITKLNSVNIESSNNSLEVVSAETFANIYPGSTVFLASEPFEVESVNTSERKIELTEVWTGSNITNQPAKVSSIDAQVFSSEMVTQIKSLLAQSTALNDLFIQNYRAINVGVKSSLRNQTPLFDGQTFIVETENQSELFYYDEADTTSLDDGETVLVGPNGERYKIFGGHDVSVTEAKIAPFAPIQVPSIADLQSKIATVDGQMYIVQGTQGGIFYYDASDTVTAPIAGMVVVNTEGQRIKRDNSDSISISSFGDPSNPEVTELATSVAVSYNLTLIGGAITITSPIPLKTGLRLEIDSITNTAPSTSANGIFIGGELDLPATSTLQYYDLNDVTKRLSTASFVDVLDASNFEPGDLVFIRGGSYYESGGNRVCSMMQLNEIATIDGANVEFSYPIPRSASDVEIALVNDLAIKDVHIKVKKVLASGEPPAKLFRQSGGMLRSTMAFENITADSISFTNALTGCEFTCGNCKFVRHVYELACGSFGNVVTISTAEMIGEGVAGKRPVRVSESSASNKVSIKELNLNKASVDPSALMYIEGYDNNFEIGVLSGTKFTGDAIRFITQAFSFVGTPHLIENNHVRVGKIYGSSTLNNFINFVDNTDGYLKNNTVELVEFADAPGVNYAVRFEGEGNKVIGGKFHHGGVYVDALSVGEYISAELMENNLNSEAKARRRYYDITLPSAAALKSFSDVYGYSKLINSSGTEYEIFSKKIPAGSLTIGDALIVKAGGQLLGKDSNAGTTGDHYIILQVNGFDVAELSYAEGEYGEFVLDSEVLIFSKTSIQYVVNGFDTVAHRFIDGAFISSIDNNDLTVRLIARHASANEDRFRLRFAKTELNVASGDLSNPVGGVESTAGFSATGLGVDVSGQCTDVRGVVESDGKLLVLNNYDNDTTPTVYEFLNGSYNSNSFNLGAVFTFIFDLYRDANSFWVCGDSVTIQEFDLTWAATARSIPLSAQGFSRVGTEYYAIEGNGFLHKYDDTTLAEIGTAVDTGIDSILGMSTDGTRLYFVNSSGDIYSSNPDLTDMVLELKTGLAATAIYVRNSSFIQIATNDGVVEFSR